MNGLGIQQVNLNEGAQTDTVKTILQHIDGNSIYARKILMEDDSSFWYVAQSELIRYNFISGSMTTLKVPGILDIVEWTERKLLVSIDQQGIIGFDKERMTFLENNKRDITDPLSLLSDRIKYMSRVRNDGFWFCSVGVGLSFTYPHKRKFDLVNPYPPGTGKAFNPASMCQYQGLNYVSVRGDGLYTLDEQSKSIKKVEGLSAETNERLKMINLFFTDDQRNLWMSTYLGPCILASGEIKPRAIGSEKNIFGISLPDGRIIFTRTDGGLAELDATSFEGDSRKIFPGHYNGSYFLYRQYSPDQVWACPDTKNCIAIHPATFDTIATIPIKGIPSSVLSSPELHITWFPTSLGLFKVDNTKMRIEKLYNEDNGFPVTFMLASLMDAHGRLWIASNANILMFDPKDESTRLYGTEDGLPGSVFNLFSSYRFEDGKMWFGSPAGMTSFYPDDITDITTPAIPQITYLQINDHEGVGLTCANTGYSNITKIERLSFSYTENTLGFIVNALEYSAPSTNKVMYKMENLDPDWVTTTNGALVRYPNMPPGKYAFFVKAFNSDGIGNDEVRRMEIVIIPPYYKTWWFRTLLVLAGLSLISLILYLRISKALEIQKVRLRLYENLHDDVGSRLTSIVMSGDMMLKEEIAPNPKLQQMVTTGRSIVNNMRRLVWAIDPVNESMESLILKIRDDRNMTLDPAIHFELDADPALQQKVIPGEIRYQLISIISEAFHNITKYAQAKNVWVHFTRNDKKLVMTVRDDGIGFDTSTVSNDKVKASGYGLGNMAKRMKRVNGNLLISSSVGNGTTITVTIPLK